MNEQIGTYFKRGEFACQGQNCCSGSAPVVPELIERLDALREIIGPIHINSGFRCHTHNRSIRSNDTSQHPKGTAADIRRDGRNVGAMADAARTAGFRGIGTYSWGIHVDVRQGESRMWNGA